jgi:hypothetical protein
MKKNKSFAFFLFFILNVFFGFACDSKTKNQPENKEIDIYTAIATNDLESVKQYIATQKDLNAKDPIGGSSPLITAALFGRTEIAKLLLDAGADIGIQNNDGSTALHVAAFFCHPEIVKMLLKKGADKSIKNKYGSTAFESVNTPYKDVKNVYQAIEQMLSSIGLKLDYAHIEKTRPLIAKLLK